MARERRRLAAILAADMAGFSRLMAADEAGTLARLRSLRTDLVDGLIADYGGRVVGSAGDSLLVEFASTIDAVECAVATQEAIAARNAELPEPQRMAFRMGINLGDVIAEGETIYGDGVNVAARLERLAEPGSVVISRSVHEQVRGKLPWRLVDLGEHAVRSIAEPLRAFRVEAGEAPSPAPREGAGAGAKLSVAVMPFANLGGDPGQRYFADGVTEDVITELSRFHRLAVLSAGSATRLREAAAAAGSPPGVHYVVEGSVRRAGERLRITARLRDAASGGQLWAEHFDRDQSEIFEVQDEIVRRIVGTVAGRVEAAGAERARRKPPASLEAYECVLEGRAIGLGDPEAEAEARRLFERAIELDPAYAQAYAKLAHILSLEWFREPSDSAETLDRAFELARRAVALDPDEPICQNILGWIHLFRRSFDLAEHYYRRALELNPNDAEQAGYMGVLHAFLGNADESLAWYRTARALDPYFEPSSFWRLQGIAHFTAGRIGEAIVNFRRSPVIPTWVHVYLAACHALAGEADEAARSRDAVLRAAPGFSLARFARKEPLRRAGDRARLVEGMRRAGLPE